MATNLVQFANIAAMSHPRNELNIVKNQSKEISHHLVYYMLNEDHITLNGHRTGKVYSPTMRRLMAADQGFRDAVTTLETCCKDLKTRHQKEIEARVGTLDISDCQLYREYQDSCHALMDEDIRWGRITVLLFFTSVLAKRLFTEGKTSKIESLVGWQSTFLNGDIAQWILEHGGWAAIKGAVSIDAAPKAAASKRQDSQQSAYPWMIAAVGVGAAIVGALAMR